MTRLNGCGIRDTNYIEAEAEQLRKAYEFQLAESLYVGRLPCTYNASEEANAARRELKALGRQRDELNQQVAMLITERDVVDEQIRDLNERARKEGLWS